MIGGFCANACLWSALQCTFLQLSAQDVMNVGLLSADRHSSALLLCKLLLALKFSLCFNRRMNINTQKRLRSAAHKQQLVSRKQQSAMLLAVCRNDIPVEYSGEEQTICAVGLAKPKSGIFVEGIQYLLVVCTPVEVCDLITASHSHARSMLFES